MRRRTLGAIETLDYSDYMDRADAVGYDDVAGFDYGYDDAVGALAGWLDSVWGAVKSVGSTVAKVATTAGTYAWKGISTTGTYAWKGVTALPQLGKQAYQWASTARVTAPIRWVVQGTKTVGKWVWNGFVWLFTSPEGQTVAPPAGVTAPTDVPTGTGEATYQQTAPQPGSVYTPAPVPYAQQPVQYVTAPQGLPGEPGAQPYYSGEQPAPSADKNIAWYIAGAIALLSAVL